MNKLNYPLRASKNKPPYVFRKDKWSNRRWMKKISKIILCFVSPLEKHLQSNQYQDLFFEIRDRGTKYVYFLFRFNFDFGFFIKPWRKRLCTWTISQERADLDCNCLLNSPLLERSDDLPNEKKKQLLLYREFLTLSQTSPGFYVPEENFFWKHCGKGRNCS